MGLLGAMLAAMVLSACGPDANATQAHASKARLDRELAHARNDQGIPAAMLAPVITQERQIASGDGWFNYDYQGAARRYDALYAQLQAIEHNSADILRQQTQADIQKLTTALNERRAQGFDQAAYYQTRLDQAIKDFGAASSPGDYAKIDATVSAQVAALHALWPAFQRLQDFKSLLRTLHTAGVDTALGDRLYDQDMQAMRDPATADYAALTGVIDGQIMQIMADQTEALPYIGAALLSAMQARVGVLREAGETDAAATFQQQHDADAKLLASARQLGDYLSLAQTVNQQTDAMALPLARAQAKHDLAALKALIAQGQTKKVYNGPDGRYYPAAYEYADHGRGYGDAENEVLRAKTLEDYLTADDDVHILLTNLRAMLDNLNDPTPHDKPHATDLQLLQDYGAMEGRAIVVSLREQTARLYENGQLVYTTNVTTGRPEKPSPPGLHYAMYKQKDMMFSSPDPAGSPLWYAPTHINYGILYANYGFFLHDAGWRRHFGPGSNLPHYDPAAFGGGSHGCINFPVQNMAYVFDWTPVGSPIIVY